MSHRGLDRAGMEERTSNNRTVISPNANMGRCRRKAHLFLQESPPGLCVAQQSTQSSARAGPTLEQLLPVGLIHSFIYSKHRIGEGCCSYSWLHLLPSTTLIF